MSFGMVDFIPRSTSDSRPNTIFYDEQANSYGNSVVHDFFQSVEDGVAVGFNTLKSFAWRTACSYQESADSLVGSILGKDGNDLTWQDRLISTPIVGIAGAVAGAVSYFAGPVIAFFSGSSTATTAVTLGGTAITVAACNLKPVTMELTDIHYVEYDLGTPYLPDITFADTSIDVGQDSPDVLEPDTPKTDETSPDTFETTEDTNTSDSTQMNPDMFEDTTVQDTTIADNNQTDTNVTTDSTEIDTTPIYPDINQTETIFDDSMNLLFEDPVNKPEDALECNFASMPNSWNVDFILKGGEIIYSENISANTFTNDPEQITSIYMTNDLGESVESPVTYKNQYGIKKWTMSGTDLFSIYNGGGYLQILTSSVDAGDAVTLQMKLEWGAGQTTCSSTFETQAGGN